MRRKGARDGVPFVGGRAHLRGAGTFLRVLGQYVREKKTPARLKALVAPGAAAAPSCNRLHWPGTMQGTDFDELAFFRAIEGCGARALLIGRRALVVLGLPVLTADYDFWLHIDDIEAFNQAATPFGLSPTHEPDDARRRGRYVLENDEHVDVLVARSVPTMDGDPVAFADLWDRRQMTVITDGVHAQLPNIADLIRTKRFGSRPKDLEDIRLLEILRREGGV